MGAAHAIVLPSVTSSSIDPAIVDKTYDVPERQVAAPSLRAAGRYTGRSFVEDLDRLAADFAARGYEPDGGELEDDQPHTHGHDQAAEAHGGGEGVRRFTYRGHEVEVVTHYQVTIDGQPWDQHLEVLDDGSVAYHGLPQYAIPSALDLIRKVIDYEEDAPEDLRAAFRAAQDEGY